LLVQENTTSIDVFY